LSFLPLLALVAVTAVWGLTFVQVKDAVELYPLFAFLALRFAIASLALAPLALSRVRSLGHRGTGAAAFLGLLLAAGYVLQTAGLERTSVSGAGFVTGMYVVLTPLIALALFRARIGLAAWSGVAIATAGLAMLSGVHAESASGDLLVLGAAAVFALQIVLMERHAPRYEPFALTFVEMATVLVAVAIVAGVRGDFEVAPRGWTVWSALVVTGVFASALAFLVQSWAQRRTSATRTALVFALEPVFAGIFGFAIAGDRLGAVGWGGCAAILAGIVLAEPAAGAVLRRALPPRRPRLSPAAAYGRRRER
jgi:drug/metabolite transporter (DMT)-like permease